MAFTGKYELESLENFEQLLKALGFSDDIVQKYKDKSSVVEFVQNGDSFQCTYHFGNRATTNNFTIGQKSEFVSFTGHKVEGLAKLEGENKLVITMQGLTVMTELSGDRMIETITNGEVTCKKISKRI
ncbi:fatty acid-binding protein 1, liver-like [Pristis pectinata]|uniref:fatty acid-binding protein 1, liver-like n=1 Tax=Pristis pectinata TaxID=685728 RepID=UPI00223CD725|nr:fatty acid-binding protein 1, liver-like [Pristis pectinata]